MVCESTYDVGGGEVLRCDKEFKGNPFRSDGVVHSAMAYGMRWTWYTDEESK